jgi:hypothetical protein
MRITPRALLIAASLTGAAACSKPADPPAADAAKTSAPTDSKAAPAAKDAPPPLPTTAPPPPVASGASGERLIPGDAALLAHVDMQGLHASPLFAANKAVMEADPEGKKQLDALTTCKVPLSGIQALDIGVGADGQAVSVIVSGAGVGKLENLRCLKDTLGGNDWKIEEQDGKARLVFGPGEAFGNLVDDNTLAIVSQDWDAALRERIAGQGSSVRDGALKDILPQADASKHVWFAGKLPPELAALASAGVAGMAGLRSVAGSLDLSTGLGLSLSFGLESPEKAKATFTDVQTQFDSVKGMAPLFGVPASAVAKVAFTVKDASVVMTAALTMDEINALSAAVNQLSAGMDEAADAADADADDDDSKPVKPDPEPTRKAPPPPT